MDFNIKVTLSADAELTALLKEIAGALNTGRVENTPQIVVATPQETAKRTRKPKAQEPEPEQPPVEEEPAQDVEEADVTLEMIQTESRKKAQAGKREEIRALVAEFGASKISDIAIADFKPFYQKVIAL